MDSPVRPDRTEQLDRTLQRIYYGILSLILGFFVYFNIVAALGTIPAVCGICHAPAHTALEQSKHSDVGCTSCHAGNEPFGIVSQRLALARMIPAKLSGFYRKPVTALVPAKHCLGCHKPIESKVIESKGLRVSHKEIISAGYACGDCHSTVAHGKNAVRQNFAEVGKCLTCHNDTTASSECASCHVNDAKRDPSSRVLGAWQISHGENWRQTHGMDNLQTCQACHSKLYCSTCHKTELPHANSWIVSHGKEVKSSNEAAAGCTQCHSESLCKNCHSLEMPHPQSFLARHSSLVKKDGDKNCYQCHLKESCTRCHKYHAHPGIPEDKLKLLHKEAGLD